jgi:hypothetical protein
MIDEPPIQLSPSMETAVDMIERLVTGRFPDATFEPGYGEDPEGIHLTVTVDREDMGDVVDLSIDRLVNMQVEEHLPLYVVPVPTIKRSLEMLRQEQERSGLLKVVP